jgi:hypothetical protein
MRTELNSSSDKIFFVSDQELIRLKDTINEQIKKINHDNGASFLFEIRLKNGAISNPSILDEILSLENNGSTLVERITINATADNAKTGLVSITFDKSGIDRFGHSIAYKIISADKDWAFICASSIEERISRITSNSFVKLFFIDVHPRIVPLIAMITMFLWFYLNIPRTEDYTAQIKELAATISDPVELIIEIAILKSSRMAPTDTFFIILVLILSIFLFVPRVLK